MAFLRQSGLRIAFVGVIIVLVLAVFRFGTTIEVALMASAYGSLKSFGISISVRSIDRYEFFVRDHASRCSLNPCVEF